MIWTKLQLLRTASGMCASEGVKRGMTGCIEQLESIVGCNVRDGDSNGMRLKNEICGEVRDEYGRETNHEPG